MNFFNISFHQDALGDHHKNFSLFGQLWKNGLIEQNRKSLIALRSASTPPSGLKFLVHKLGPIWIITPGGKIGYLEFSKSRPTLIFISLFHPFLSLFHPQLVYFDPYSSTQMFYAIWVQFEFCSEGKIWKYTAAFLILNHLDVLMSKAQLTCETMRAIQHTDSLL